MPHRTDSDILSLSRSCHVGMVTYPVTLKRDLAHEPVPFLLLRAAPSGGTRGQAVRGDCRGAGAMSPDAWSALPGVRSPGVAESGGRMMRLPVNQVGEDGVTVTRPDREG